MCHLILPIWSKARTAEEYLNKLKGLIETNKDKVAVIGECGVEYGRLTYVINSGYRKCRLERNRAY